MEDQRGRDPSSDEAGQRRQPAMLMQARQIVMELSGLTLTLPAPAKFQRNGEK